MQFRQYLNVVFERKWIIFQAIIVVTAIVLGLSFTQPRVYEATAKAQMKPTGSGTVFSAFVSSDFWTDPDRRLQTQMQLIKREPVAERVIKKLNLDYSSGQLLSEVSVSQVGQTDVIEIKVQDEYPKRARDIANTLALEFIDLGQESSAREIASARREVFLKMQETKDAVVAAAKEISKRGGEKPPELETEWELATRLYVMLAEKYEQLRIDEALRGGGAELISPAVTPVSPIKPRPLQSGVTGILSGMIFGLALAFFVEYLDNTVKSTEDMEKYTEGAPVLGEVISDERAKDIGILSEKEPKSVYAESIRTLRTNIQFINYEGALRSLVFTSSGAKEGKTTTVANLGISMAHAGSNVVILSADLRRPWINKLFGLDNTIGLTTVLTGRAKLDEALRSTTVPGLVILCSGPLPPNPSELLGSRRMLEVLRSLEERADIVLIDTPPTGVVTDAAVIARAADGVIVVAAAGKTTREMLQHTKGLLDTVEARILGSILNEVEPVKRYYGYGYYRHYYQDYYGEEKKKKGWRRKKKKPKKAPQKVEAKK